MILSLSIASTIKGDHKNCFPNTCIFEHPLLHFFSLILFYTWRAMIYSTPFLFPVLPRFKPEVSASSLALCLPVLPRFLPQKISASSQYLNYLPVVPRFLPQKVSASSPCLNFLPLFISKSFLKFPVLLSYSLSLSCVRLSTILDHSSSIHF